MDGKQARRTKAASPLGLLFDHGIDMWAIPFMNIVNLATAIGTGDTVLTGAVLMYAFSMIYFLNVEQFYTRILRLGSFDANADGIHGNTLCFILSAIWGTCSSQSRCLSVELEAAQHSPAEPHLHRRLDFPHDVRLLGQVRLP